MGRNITELRGRVDPLRRVLVRHLRSVWSLRLYYLWWGGVVDDFDLARWLQALRLVRDFGSVGGWDL